MKRLNVEVRDVEETWGDYLLYEEVLDLLLTAKLAIIGGSCVTAIEAIDKQLEEWGEDV